MADLYVDNSVAGPGTGTFLDPWDDISSNFGSVGAGDTVNFFLGTGTYNEGQVNITISGTPGNPITFQPYAGAAIVWNCGAADDQFDITGDYIIIDGFEIDMRSQGRKAIDLRGDNNLIQNCDIHAGAFDYLVQIRGDDNTILNCDIYDNDDGPGNDAQGISISSGADGTIVRGCNIYDCRGDCIQVNQIGGWVGTVLVDDCVLYTTLAHCSENGLDTKEAAITVTDCEFYGFVVNPEPGQPSCGGSGSPAGQAIITHVRSRSLDVSGCDFHDCEVGIYLNVDATYWTGGSIIRNSIHDLIDDGGADLAFLRILNCPDITICNNTMANHAGGTSLIWDSSTGIMRNCIIEGAANIDDDGTNPTVSNNCWWNVTDTWPGGNDVNADPEFTDEASQDYTLLAISPCIDAGTTTSCNVSYNGTAPDMGAFEFAAAPDPPPATSEGEAVTPLPSTISPRWESKQLSASLYKPEIGSYTPRGTLVLDNLSELWTSYRHSKKRVGGYWDATITQRGNISEIEDWIFRLGYHLEVYNPALERIWEGFVNRVRLQIGGFTVERGPLLDVVNRGYLVYSTVDTTTDPPTVGVRATSAAQQDTDSQGRYGILEKYASAGGVAATSVNDIITVYVAEHARPRTGKRWNNRESVTPTATVELLGYVHFLKLYVFNSTTTGTRTLPLKIQDILGGDPNGLFSTDYSKIDPDGVNTATIKRYNNDNQTAWAQIKSIVARGDGTDPWNFGIYNDRQAFYDIAPSDWDYSQALLDPKQRISEYGGPEVAPWDVEPGKLMLATDFLIGKTLPAATPREDERTTFIEQVSFIYPQFVDIVGSQYNTLSQRLATLGLSGIG